MGIGMMMIVSEKDSREILDRLKVLGEKAYLIGVIEKKRKIRLRYASRIFNGRAMAELLKLGVLISGSGSNLQSIIDNIEKGALPAQIKIVVSNNPQAYGLTRSKRHGIPCTVLIIRIIPVGKNLTAN